MCCLGKLVRHLHRGILLIVREGPSELNTSPYFTEHQRGGKDIVSRDPRKVNSKTRERSNRRIKLHPNIHISVANLFIARLPDTPPPKTVLQLLRRLQEGYDGFPNAWFTLQIQRVRSHSICFDFL